MRASEYSGFACTCRLALSLVKIKTDTPENRDSTFLESRSRGTSFFVEARRLSGNPDFILPAAENWGDDLCICYGPDPDENDSDL